jgi:flagellar assembly protein FliH
MSETRSAAEIPPQTRLLKANDVRGLGSKVVFNFADLRQQGDAYIEATRKQATEMLEQAAHEVATVRLTAHETGLQLGREEGLREAGDFIEQRAREMAEQKTREHIATTIPAMKAAGAALAIERDRWLSQWEATAVRLAAAIAEKLMRRRLERQPAIAAEMIRAALQLAAGTPRITLRVHPLDASLLAGQGTEITQALASCGDAAVVADENVTRGGCVIETQHGTIDARVEALLERIVAELTESDL